VLEDAIRPAAVERVVGDVEPLRVPLARVDGEAARPLAGAGDHPPRRPERPVLGLQRAVLTGEQIDRQADLRVRRVGGG
jgi:hypothetical protein